MWAGMRWVIGDIHGMLRPLEALLNAIARRDLVAEIICVGDYVNRGPNSCGVIDRLLSLERATFLRGNHDDVFDLILHGDCYASHNDAPDPLNAFRWFTKYGLVNTLESYGLDYAQVEQLSYRLSIERLRDALQVVPASHRNFLRALKPVVEFDDAFVAHAMWDVNEPDSGPGLRERMMSSPRLRYRTLWGRLTAEQIRQVKLWKRTGYFGHTPVSNYMSSDAVMPIGGPKSFCWTLPRPWGDDSQPSASTRARSCRPNRTAPSSMAGDAHGIPMDHPGIATLRPHRLQIALFQPQIAPNTGNIGRLCVAAGAALHLVRPMGFVLSDRQLKRSAMDYWPRLRLTVHDDNEAFFKTMEGATILVFHKQSASIFLESRLCRRRLPCVRQ